MLAPVALLVAASVLVIERNGAASSGVVSVAESLAAFESPAVTTSTSLAIAVSPLGTGSSTSTANVIVAEPPPPASAPPL